jgi:hypothetical protein
MIDVAAILHPALRPESSTMSSPSIDTADGVRRIGYPGELGIPPVGVSFEIPAAWVTAPMPGAMAVTMEREPGAAGFRANIVTSIQRASVETTLDEAGTELLEESRASVLEFVHVAEHVVAVEDRPAILREQSIRIAETELELVQFVLILVVDRVGVAADVVQLTGSVELDRRDTLGTLFEHLVDSIAIDV